MKWGLVPHWSKEAPEWSNISKTFNARDDTISEGGGMWKAQRGKKRCLVVCQGFYEWLKKGNQKVPHFTKMPKGQKLMVFAGLWDCAIVNDEPVYTFTIVTTSSNKQLTFLHDRMPVIFNTHSQFESWLNVAQNPWGEKVAKMMQPFEGSLECYKVTPDVGKVGNDSPDMIIPVAERKGTLNALFAKQASKASTSASTGASNTSKPAPPASPSKKKKKASPSPPPKPEAKEPEEELALKTSRPGSEWDSSPDPEDGQRTPTRILEGKRPTTPTSPTPTKASLRKTPLSSGKGGLRPKGQLTLDSYDLSMSPPKAKSSPFAPPPGSASTSGGKGKRKASPPPSPSKSGRRIKKARIEVEEETPPTSPSAKPKSSNVTPDRNRTPELDGTPHRHVESGVSKLERNTDVIPSPKKDTGSWSIHRKRKMD
ncbi:DUF159-domain-containing protein, partial [Atractiella rhizophila]